MLRIGQGWDIHALSSKRKLIIGGVRIPYHLGLLGHSDADVLLHAITDALLGATALGDIGTHFPDHDARFINADSLTLLSDTWQKISEKGWQIINIDSTVIAQAPRLAPYINKMCANIAQALDIDIKQINVKAKTSENLDSTGQGKSMQAQAIALLTN